ncbi:MAG: hypothetical protein CMO21_12230 [Thioclava sp.]|nr:hypothetical protein [Thioclava sp.]|tara:strand:- start:1078 stop:1308 length:231 start_codon:yes stop_codon:yes gene_type:complete
MLIPEFLTVLLSLVEREPALRHVEYWVSTYSTWLTAAEKARDHVLDLHMAILDERCGSNFWMAGRHVIHFGMPQSP